ncbi:MAG: nicotinamide-nucleotide amidohydrolase family protein [Lachnospiraceae bacterium]|nr:nicotinamide-nucleotide amidohydrolase family protein [Lachnospiraceae bacterium]
MTDRTPEQDAVELLHEMGMTVSAAESCTGGLVCARLINVPGASDVLNEGFITYSNEAKMKHLNVSAETLREHGAVSAECAAEMASGLAENTGADAAVSTTGIAGPGGGTDEKPVGLVYIGVCIKGETAVREFHFEGDRMKVRTSAAEEAVKLLADCLRKRK